MPGDAESPDSGLRSGDAGAHDRPQDGAAPADAAPADAGDPPDDPPPASSWTLAAGDWHACMVRGDGSLLCWGGLGAPSE